MTNECFSRCQYEVDKMHIPFIHTYHLSHVPDNLMYPTAAKALLEHLAENKIPVLEFTYKYILVAEGHI
jgi:hypothetical protein